MTSRAAAHRPGDEASGGERVRRDARLVLQTPDLSGLWPERGEITGGSRGEPVRRPSEGFPPPERMGYVAFRQFTTIQTPCLKTPTAGAGAPGRWGRYVIFDIR
jgi:hypothetical protein